MPLKLVNPQPMETLPANGDCFADVTSWDDLRYVVIIRAKTLYNGLFEEVYPTVHAWSYTATFEEVGG